MCNSFMQVATAIKVASPLSEKYKQGVHSYGASKCKSARIDVDGYIRLCYVFTRL